MSTSQVRYRDLDVNFTLTPSGDVATVMDRAAVKQAVSLLLHTDPGDRVMRSDVGCNLKNLLFEPFDEFTADTMTNVVLSSLRNYEPRINIVNVNVDLDYDTQKYNLTLFYSLVNSQKVESLNVILQKM